MKSPQAPPSLVVHLLTGAIVQHDGGHWTDLSKGVVAWGNGRSPSGGVSLDAAEWWRETGYADRLSPSRQYDLDRPLPVVEVTLATGAAQTVHGYATVADAGRYLEIVDPVTPAKTYFPLRLVTVWNVQVDPAPVESSPKQTAKARRRSDR